MSGQSIGSSMQDLKELVGVVMETVFFLEHEHCNCVNLLPKVQHTVTCYTNLEYVKVHACHDEVHQGLRKTVVLNGWKISNDTNQKQI